MRKSREGEMKNFFNDTFNNGKSVERNVFSSFRFRVILFSSSFNEKFPLGIVLFKIQLMPFRFYDEKKTEIYELRHFS